MHVICVHMFLELYHSYPLKKEQIYIYIYFFKVLILA